MKNIKELNKENLSKVSGAGYDNKIIGRPDGNNGGRMVRERNTESGFCTTAIYTNW